MSKKNTPGTRIPREMIQAPDLSEIVNRVKAPEGSEAFNSIDMPVVLHMPDDGHLLLHMPIKQRIDESLFIGWSSTLTGRINSSEPNFVNEPRDIHRETAAKIHGVVAGNVTSTQRREAAEVNFGVLYGVHTPRLYRGHVVTGKETDWLYKAISRAGKSEWTRKIVRVHLQAFNNPANMRTPGHSAMLAEFVGAGREVTPSMGASVPHEAPCGICEKTKTGR